MHKKKKKKHMICCHCNCVITYRPRPPEAPLAICACLYRPFETGAFVHHPCTTCHQRHCICKPKHHHHHHHKRGKVALPKEIAQALTVLLYHEGWMARELFTELTEQCMNPTLTLSDDMRTLYDWANERGKQNQRFDLLLRAFDFGFYAECTPEQQLEELFKRYDQLEEPYRTNAFNVGREILAIFNIDSPLI